MTSSTTTKKSKEQQTPLTKKVYDELRFAMLTLKGREIIDEMIPILKAQEEKNLPLLKEMFSFLSLSYRTHERYLEGQV